MASSNGQFMKGGLSPVETKRFLEGHRVKLRSTGRIDIPAQWRWRLAKYGEPVQAGPGSGTLTGTGSYSLTDGSTVHTPGTGVYLADKEGTNLENYGVRPD